MFRRNALLALACFSLLAVVVPRAASAQSVRRLSTRDVPALVNELRVRLNVPDTTKGAVPAPAPARLSDKDFAAMAEAAVQALRDLNDPTDLASQEACAAQWGSRDAAGADVRKSAQARRSNLDLLKAQAAVLVPLVEKYEKTGR